MPYLSRVWLNPLRKNAQQFLRNPEKVHAAVLGGLARQPVDERVLWRLDPDPVSEHRRLELLILTESRPSWEHIVEQAGWPNADQPQALTRPYEPLLDQVMRGRRFALRLKANPASTTKHPDAPSPQQKQHLADQARPRGVRVPHRTAAHQLDWFTTRVTRWGFTVVTGDAGLPALRLTARDRLSFHKRRADGQTTAPVVLQTATFEGIVEIADPETARRSLLGGVGAGKAYGLGLITLAPPTTAWDPV
jgi:CRISPR system Cascade subunit CasE